MPLSAAIAVALLSAQTYEDLQITEVDSILVIGHERDYRLQVDIQGAHAPSTLVVSADPGMNCGDARFERTPGPWRQCWLRGRRGEPILLTAQHEGVFGRDWTIEWTGCEPQGDGRTCAAAIAGEMRIGARFRGM